MTAFLKWTFFNQSSVLSFCWFHLKLTSPSLLCQSLEKKEDEEDEEGEMKKKQEEEEAEAEEEYDEEEFEEVRDD